MRFGGGTINERKPLQTLHLVFCCPVAQKKTLNNLYEAGLERFITNICLEKKEAQTFIYTHQNNRSRNIVNYRVVMYCCFWLTFSPMSQSQHSRDDVWLHTKLILQTNRDI